jgi:thioredoxin-related protein
MKLGKCGLVCLVIICFTIVSDNGLAASTGIKWHSFKEGMVLGNSSSKKIFLNFHADWCGYCHVMEKKTFRNRAVVTYLNENFISIKVDYDREKKISALFRVNGLPDNWFFSKDGEIIGNRPGYIPPNVFLKILKSFIAGDKKNKDHLRSKARN